MGVDGALVEGVDDRRLGIATGLADRRGDCLELVERAPDEMDAGALTGEGPGDGTTDRSAGAVDDRVLVLQQHR